MRPLLMLPEALVFGAALLVLISGSFLPRRRLWCTRVLAAAALAGAAVAGGIGMAGADTTAFQGAFAVDTVTGLARILVPLATAVVVAVAGEEIGGSARESEVYALLLCTTAGVLVLCGADDLLVLATGYLLASIPLYALIGMAGSPGSAEAAMKTYLLGALAGILLLLGIAVLYAMAAATRYADLAVQLPGASGAVVGAGLIGVMAGLLFKAGAVPLHFWVPDAAQGTTGYAAMYLTTVPKIGAVVALYRLVVALPDDVAWPLVVGLLAAAGMTLGNLAAFWQQDPRRLLGWSTVSQVGFLLVPVAAVGASELALPSLLFYLAGYTVTNIAAFAVTTALPQARALSDYRGMARAHPWLSGALVVALLGLLGTPPTAVFVGKLTTASAAWEAGAPWLAVAVFVNTLISLFYYLRWIVPTFQAAGGSTPKMSSPQRISGVVAVTMAALSVLLGIAAGGLWAVLAAAG
ncbi:MAG: NADH-quinone oxidoreductase subunit N [Actinomycetota bacterium]|nr:NADH-quinone oxidoreductase subunit N [Actinomycetota bacterium]